MDLIAEHRDLTTLEAGLDHVRLAPSNGGVVALIVRRPAVEEREVVEEATLDLRHGLAGDNWQVRGSKSTPDGSADPDRQLTVMNARAAALVAVAPERWQLAGDQLYLDLDLSVDNLPPGTRLAIGGDAIIEITDKPHLGCAKFNARFGVDALRLVNSPVGRELRLRGANARVVVPGTVRRGDEVRKLPA